MDETAAKIPWSNDSREELLCGVVHKRRGVHGLDVSVGADDAVRDGLGVPLDAPYHDGVRAARVVQKAYLEATPVGIFHREAEFAEGGLAAKAGVSFSDLAKQSTKGCRSTRTPPRS